MKLFIVVACAFVAVAVAAPAESQTEPAQIIRSDVNQNPDGSYNFNVETSDGYIQQQSGELVEVPNEEGKPVKVIIVRGSYSYTDNLGNRQSITYVSDQDGFHPEGDSIPKNPEPSRR